MAPSHYIGVDIGGTNIRAARFVLDSQIPEPKTKILTQANLGLDTVLDRIEVAIREVAGDDLAGIAGVGMAAPGPIDPYSGLLLRAANLPGWVDVPLRRLIEERIGRPTFLGNDANLAALGEWKFGAGRGHSDVLYMTISTGIGGGVVTGGRLLLGARGLAAEIGHMLAVPDGPLCGCGQRGHLEAVASGTALGRTARERLVNGEGADSRVLHLAGGRLEDITGAVVGAAALAGDEFAIGLVVEAGTLIGRTLASLLHAYNPSMVICGGGGSLLGDVILDPMRQAVQQYAMDEGYWRNCPIVLGTLGDDGGLVGAAALAMESMQPADRTAQFETVSAQLP
jgi:glucokinase